MTQRDFKLEKEDFNRPFVGVGAIILKQGEDGKEFVLLGRRKGVAGAGKWHVPGGHLKMNERFSECVKREVLEETGLKVKVGKLLWIEENFDMVHHINLYFEARLLDNKQKPRNLEPHKCEEWRWFPIENLPTPLWTLDEFFKKYRNRTRIKSFGAPARDWIGVGVIAVIVDEKGRVLMQKRGRQARDGFGEWKLPSGEVEYGEKVESALKREMKEELGIDISIVKFLFNAEVCLPQEGEHWLTPVYLCKIKKGKPKILEPGKCEEIGWFEIDNLPTNICSSAAKIIDDLKNFSFFAC